MGQIYQGYNYRGMWFSPLTPQKVLDILVDYTEERGERLSIVYGDGITGEAWLTEEDAKKYGVRSAGVEGYIGRSTGSRKVPLEIPNSRSLGGQVILDQHIVLIRTAKGKRELYKHPNFKWKETNQ